MAGIGFELRRLSERDAIGSSLHSYTHAALVACGPWLFTVLALWGFELVGRNAVDARELEVFSTVITYNFSFSLVIAGPIVLVITRLLADKIYVREVREVPGILVGGLALLIGVHACVGLPFYGLVVNLSPVERVLALICFHLIGAIWLVAVFLSALKSFRTIGIAFALGMVGSLMGGLALIEKWGAIGALASFTGGLTAILYILLARVLAEYPYSVVRPFGFLGAFNRYWQFALFGFFYNAAIWIDKWVMWCSPQSEIIAGAMPTFPVYDGAMFLAYLSIVPAMAFVVVSVETRFFEGYRRFFDDIGNHATIDQIYRNHVELLEVLQQAFRNITVLQCVICYLAILVAPALISAAHGGLEMIPILRIGTLSALFHVLLLFAIIIMSYFDLRGSLVVISATFFASNGVFTGGTLFFGPELYGFGYFLSVLLSLTVAYNLASRSIGRLPYMTFVGNNRGLS